MASNYVTKIRTVDGDKQIDYNALANLPSIYLKSEVDKALAGKVSNSDFDTKVSNKVSELVSNTAYNKSQILSNDTRTLFGLTTSAIPDDVLKYLGKYAKHHWKRRTASYVGEPGPSGACGFISGADSTNTSVTVYYSTSLTFTESGEFSLTEPLNSITISYNTYGNVATLRGKYFYKGSDKKKTIYYAASNAAYTRTNDSYMYGVSFTSGCGLVYSKMNYGEWEIINSTSDSSYPKFGMKDGYEYVYLGIPFENSISPIKILTGNYVGSGSYGVGNENSLTFNSVPELVFISSNTSTLSSRRASLALVRGSGYGVSVDNSSVDGLTLKWSGNQVLWYSDNVKNQLNEQGTIYYYAAIIN